MSPDAILARRHKVTTRTIARWRKAGAPVTSARGLATWRKRARAPRPRPTSAAASMEELERGLLRDALREIGAS